MGLKGFRRKRGLSEQVVWKTWGLNEQEAVVGSNKEGKADKARRQKDGKSKGSKRYSSLTGCGQWEGVVGIYQGIKVGKEGVHVGLRRVWEVGRV